MLFTKCLRLLLQTQLKPQSIILKSSTSFSIRKFSTTSETLLLPQKIEVPKGALEIQYSRSSGPGLYFVFQKIYFTILKICYFFVVENDKKKKNKRIIPTEIVI